MKSSKFIQLFSRQMAGGPPEWSMLPPRGCAGTSAIDRPRRLLGAAASNIQRKMFMYTERARPLTVGEGDAQDKLSRVRTSMTISHLTKSDANITRLSARCQQKKTMNAE